MPRKRAIFWVIAPGGHKWQKREGLTAFAEEIGVKYDTLKKAIKGPGVINGWRITKNPDNLEDENSTIEKAIELQSIRLISKALLDRDQTPISARDFAKDGLSRLDRQELIRRWASRAVAQVAHNISRWTIHPESKPQRADPTKDLEAIRKIVESEGLEWKHVQDARTPAEKFLDAAGQLLTDPESLFEQPDEVIDAMIQGCSTAYEHAEKYIEHNAALAEHDPNSHPVDPSTFPPWMRGQHPKTVAQVMARWLARLARVKQLRAMVRQPVPTIWDNGTRLRRLALAATQVLRFQIYVGRSDIAHSGNMASSVFKIGRHHAKMAVDIYTGMHRAAFEPRYLLIFAGEEVTTEHGARRTFLGNGLDGVLAMYPPRHGKTVYLRHLAAFLINENHRTQGAYLHARQDEAQAFNKYVQSLFKPDNRAGRRNLSLFPAQLASYDNGASTTRIATDDPPKNPNLFADSVWASAQGNNLDWVIGDDMVPQDDTEMATQRERRKQRFAGTWLTRLQGPQSFFIVSGYPWHHEDLLYSMLTDARRNMNTGGREGRNIKVSMMAVGGPKTSPPYKPIWREMYGRRALRRIYRRLGDAAVWAANYQLRPLTDDIRIVRRIRLYDPSPDHDPLQHQRFLMGAEIHLSLDPAFTKSTKSDRAGLVRVGVGQVTENSDQGGRHIITTTTRIRVLDAMEIHATQKDLSDTTASIAKMHRVDMVHVETGNAGEATVEFLSALHGIETVTRHVVGNRDKERRLREVAFMLEADAQDLEAVVEFPGVRAIVGKDPETGAALWGLKIDPRFKRLQEYIVNFRVTSGHHCLDALTQVLKFLAPVAGVGEGATSAEARRHVATTKPNRKAQMLQAEQEFRAQMQSDDILGFAAPGYHA